MGRARPHARRDSLLAALAVCFVAAAPAARGQALAGPGEATESRFRREVRGHWFSWLAAHEEGDSALAASKVDEILRHSQKLGVRRLTDLALSATLIGRRDATRAAADRARLAFEAAVRLDPDLPEARWALVSLALRSGEVSRSPGLVAAAARAVLADAESRRAALWRAVALLSLSAVAVGVIFAILLVVAHGRRLGHDLLETVGSRLPGTAAWILAGAILVAPLLLGFDPVWTLLWLVALLLGYADRSQRLLVAVFVLSVIPALFLLDRAAYEMDVSASPIRRGAEALAEGRYDQRVVDNLEGVKNLIPEDADTRFLLGRLYQSLGQNDKAVAEYTQSAQVSPSEARALLNRGNIRYVDGDFGSAEEDYREALRRDPRLVAARYNLSLVFAETFRTVEAVETLREAQALDAALIQRYQSNPTLVKVVSIGYSPEEARTKVESLWLEPRTRRILGHFRSWRLSDALTTPVAWGALLALAGGIVLDRRRQRGRGYAALCQKCGRSFCRLCKPPGESALLCSQCVHVYLKEDGVAIETKLQKVEEVKRRRGVEGRLRLAVNAVFPGAAAFLDGHATKSAAALCLFILGLFALFGRDLLVSSPRPNVAEALPVAILWGTVAFLGWAFGQLSARRA